MDGEEVSKCNNEALSHELPDEMIIEILSKLTLKGLGICSCVSKLWRDSFIIQAFKRHHSYSSDAINEDGVTTLLYDPWSPTDSNKFKLLTFEIPGKCNKNENYTSIIEGQLRTLPTSLSKFYQCSNIYHGLVCLYNQWVYSLLDFSIILYSTRANVWVALPTSRNHDNFLNGKKHHHRCFLGFDTLRKEYKIVRMITYFYNGCDKISPTLCETLLLGSRSWNQIDDVKVPSLLSVGWKPTYDQHGVCFDGVIFWMHLANLRATTHGPVAGDLSHIVVAFDLNLEEFRVFHLDKILLECSFRPTTASYLAASRGCPTVLTWNAYNHHEMLVCTFSDCKMTSVAWRKRFAWWAIYPQISVCHSRIVVRCNSSTMNEDLCFKCTDLENDITWKIHTKR